MTIVKFLHNCAIIIIGLFMYIFSLGDINIVNNFFNKYLDSNE